MAMTAMAMQNTQIGPTQFADMQLPLRAGFAVDGALDMRPTYSGRNVTVGTGAGMIGGSRVRVASAETVAIPAVSSGIRWDAVCVRVDWRNSTTKAVVVTGNSLDVAMNASSTSADNTKINRIPGICYDAVIALVKSTSGSSALTQVIDLRPYGGYGMPFYVSDAALEKTQYLDLPAGAMVQGVSNSKAMYKNSAGSWTPAGPIVGTETYSLFNNGSATITVLKIGCIVQVSFAAMDRVAGATVQASYTLPERFRPTAKVYGVLSSRGDHYDRHDTSPQDHDGLGTSHPGLIAIDTTGKFDWLTLLGGTGANGVPLVYYGAIVYATA